MNESLEARLGHLRNRVRQLLCLYGMSWLITVVLGTTLIVGWLDWRIHFDDPSLRLVLALGILVSGAWVCWRFLLRPLFTPLTDVDLALQIERRYPHLQDSLASTVQFRDGFADPSVGSPALQKQVVANTLKEIEELNVDDVLQTDQVKKVTIVAVLVCLVVSLVVGMNQANAAIAVKRLLFPYSSGPWPKRVHLELVTENLHPIRQAAGEVHRVARGDTIEVFVTNTRGELPEDGRLETRIKNGRVVSEPLRKTTLRLSDDETKEVFVASLVLTQGPFQLRAVGGDHHEMPWYTLEVVPPPMVEQFQVTLTPPPYAQEKPETLPENVGHLRGLVGSEVVYKGTVNKSLKSAHLLVKNQPPKELQVHEDRLGFTATFRLPEGNAQPYTYSFDLVDEQGFRNSDPPRYDVQAISDLAPDVYFDRPASDLQVTKTAVIPMRVKAADDRGLKSVLINWHFSGGMNEAKQTIPLYDDTNREPQVISDYLWKMAELDVPEGTQILYHAEARDYYNLGDPHIAESNQYTLTVVSPETKLNEIDAHQTEILETLQRVLEQEANAQEQVRELLIQLNTVKTLRPADEDRLRNLDGQHHQQIVPRLVRTEHSGGTSLEELTNRLLTDLDQNQLPAPETRQRLNLLKDDLKQLRERLLPAVGQPLTQAAKRLNTFNQDFPLEEEKADLSATANAQDKVIRSLEQLTELFSEWQSQEDLTGGLENLINGQEALNRDTLTVGEQIAGNPGGRPNAQQKAELEKLTKRQEKQEELLNEFTETLRKAITEAKENGSADEEFLEEAEQLLKDRKTAEDIAEAARLLKQPKVGDAIRKQEESLNELSEIRDLLKGRRPVTDTETLIQTLNEAADKLETLRKEHQELLDKTEQLKKQPADQQEELKEELKKKQEELQEQLGEIQRLLRKVDATRPQQSLKRAGDRMRQAEREMQSSPDPDDPEKLEKLEQLQQEIKDDLEQTARELAEERQQAEEKLVQESLEKFLQELPSFVAREELIIESTERLEELRQKQGNLTRVQGKTLRDLAKEQQQLGEDLGSFGEQVKDTELLVFLLERITGEMQKAATRLGERKTDAPTVRAEKRARDRLLTLVETLKSSQTDRENEPGPSPGATNDGEENPQQNAIPPLTQLKIVKALQEEIHEQTRELHELERKNGTLDADGKQEYEELVLLQTKLTTISRNLMERFLQQNGPAPQR